MIFVKCYCDQLQLAKIEVTSYAREMRLQLEAPASRLHTETVLVELEGNKKTLESLEINLSAKGKSGAANSSDRRI
jgi:hypothetical protein